MASQAPTALGTQTPGVIGGAPIPAPGPTPVVASAPTPPAVPTSTPTAGAGLADPSAVQVASGGPQSESMLASYDAMGAGQPNQFAASNPTNYATDASFGPSNPVLDASPVNPGGDPGMQNLFKPGFTETEIGQLKGGEVLGNQGSVPDGITAESIPFRENPLGSANIKPHAQLQAEVTEALTLKGPGSTPLPAGEEVATKSVLEKMGITGEKGITGSIQRNPLPWAIGTAFLADKVFAKDEGEGDYGSGYEGDATWESGYEGRDEGIGRAVAGDNRPSGSSRERRYYFGRV